MTQICLKLTLAATSLTLFAPMAFGQHTACPPGAVPNVEIASNARTRPTGSAILQFNAKPQPPHAMGTQTALNENGTDLPLGLTSACGLPLTNFEDTSGDTAPVVFEEAADLIAKPKTDFMSRQF